MIFFTDVTLTYNGETKIVKADNVLRLIAIIEQYMPVAAVLHAKAIPAATMAIVFEQMLLFAGFKNVDVNQLAVELRSQEFCYAVIGQCLGLLKLLSLPEDLQSAAEDNGVDDTVEKKEAAPE